MAARDDRVSGKRRLASKPRPKADDRGWRNDARSAIGCGRRMRPRTAPLGRNNRMQNEGEHRQTAAELARPIGEDLAGGNESRARELARSLSAPDLADVIELLEPDARVQLIHALGDYFPSDVLSELDGTVRDQLLRELPKDVLA